MATILENVQTLSVHLEDAYTALEGKGATIPQQKNATNLSATVDSLPAAGFTIDDLLGTTAKDLVINVTEIPAGVAGSQGGGAYNLFRVRNVVSTVDFPNLVKVNTYSCANMFNANTSVTALKSLPATTLAQSCYNNMFYQATNLRFAPATLPATTLASNCYYGMFNSTSLSAAPELPATTLVQACYQNMFYGCKSLTSFQGFPGPLTLASTACSYMFGECTNLTGEIVVPIADQGTVPSNVFQYMFAGCPNITKVVLDFTRQTAVPTLGSMQSVNVFNSTSDTRLEIRVPAALEASWKTATNWSTWASRIVGV